MDQLAQLRSVRLASSELDASVRFATEILGLELVRRDARRAYLRASAGHDHHVQYVRGELGDEALAFELADPGALAATLGALERTGHRIREGTPAERDERLVAELFAVSDPTGNRIELVRGSAGAAACAYTRDAGITSFSHVGLRTTDAPRDEQFWTRALGARVSDWIGEAALLRIDDVHHRIALFPAQRPGIQHVNFQAASIDDVMRSYYFLRDRGVRIVFGPGRHPTSGAVFLYFAGPDDLIYEYSTGVRSIAPGDEATYQPRRFPLAPTSFCMWGALPDIPEFRPEFRPEVRTVRR
jgi:2,3-dihydroxy-p-cumate/2,3-dihydroxybenzoate 3,4-dioxygenase